MASSSSAPISSSTRSRWDVFLSFRGIDTRSGFTSHLHSSLVRTGIPTFIDEPELRAGDVISTELRHAIGQSKIYIVVLSENYASSGWCLDELVEILGWWKSLGRLVLPIFYKIEPSVVRYQIGSFKEAFEKHENRVAMELVKKWRGTLNEVAALSGYHVRDEVPVGGLCIKLTDHAASGYELCENRHLKTEADIISDVIKRVLLEINPMTLEVARYPVAIESRVASIESLLRTDSSSINGVHWIGIHGMGGVGKTTLAKAFYNQMYRSFDGSCFLTDIKDVCVTPIGIVSLQKQLIDDVLKCKNTATFSNIDVGINTIRERIGSLELLVVLDDLDDRNQVDYLVGKFLVGSVIILTTRNEDLLDTLGVKARYMVNILDYGESRQLFNYHAFGDTKITEEFGEISDKILRHAGGLPLALTLFGSSLTNKSKEEWKLFIDKLQQLPIETSVEEKLKISYEALKSVHPKLQDFFLDIACFFIGWRIHDAVRVLETYYGELVNVYINMLKKRCFITTKWNQLWMHDLLRGMGRNIAGNSRLSVREHIRDALENNKGTEAVECMVDLELWKDRSSYLSDALEFSGDHSAERFYRMQFRRYQACYPYSFDAETFNRMPKLRFLVLTKNVNMRGCFGKPFEDLRWLRWHECTGLPSNFSAEKLVILELPYNSICKFTEKSLDCRNLKVLDMSYSYELTKTPDFNGLLCLQTLILSSCNKLVEVDISIGNLERLATLDLSCCGSLVNLPDSICKLRALKTLDIKSCSRLKASFMELLNFESLTKLEAEELSFSQLPDSLGRLRKSVKLVLTKSTNLLQTICNLRLLESLSLQFKASMAYRPSIQLQLPSTLKVLQAHNCLSLLSLPNLSNLLQLEKIHLSNCSSLTEIEGLEKLISITELDFNGFKSMKRLPNLCNLLKIEKIHLSNCSSLTEIEGLEKLISVQELHLDGCKLIQGLPNLSNLQNLKSLRLNGCSILAEIHGLEEVISVEELHLGHCESIQELPNLSNLKNLKSLRLNGCRTLTEIRGLEKLISITELDFRGCRSIKRVPNLSNLQQLKTLVLRNCSSLTEVEGVEKLISITQLDLSGCTSLKRLPILSNLQKLQKINLSSLTEFEGLEKVVSVEELHSDDSISMQRLPNLSDLQNLKSMQLNGCSRLTDIKGLEELISIEELYIEGCTSIEVLPNLSNLRKLKSLKLKDCSSLTKIQGLAKLWSIEELNVEGCTSIKVLPNLSNLRKLKSLKLKDCSSLTEIQGLAELWSIEELHLEGCTSIKVLPNLYNFQELKSLKLKDCSSLVGIQGLEGVISLIELDLGGCTSLKRLPNISNLGWLERINFPNSSNFNGLRKLFQLSNLQQLKSLESTNLQWDYQMEECFFEPLESEDVPPPLENGSASSVPTTADEGSCSDQAVRPPIIHTYNRRAKQIKEFKFVLFVFMNFLLCIVCICYMYSLYS